MNRRQFLVRFVGTMAAVPVVVHVVGCGDDDPAGPAGLTQLEVTSSTAAIPVSHSHRAILTCTQISGAADVGLLSEADATAHQHTLTLTAAQLATIAGGSSVTITDSGVPSHTHSWTFLKPANVC